MNTALVITAATCGVASMLASWALTLVSTTEAFELERTPRQRFIGLASFILSWFFAAFGSFSFVWLGTLI